MSAEVRMVCKECGGDRFHAEARIEAWVRSTGVFLDDDGKPHFEPDGRPEDTWDYEIDDYICSGCDKRSWRLENLVVKPPPADEPIAPCGRCDHGRAEHAEQALHGRGRPDYYERGAMPCEHDGCDCHDYYDLAVAEAGQPSELLAAVGRVAA